MVSDIQSVMLNKNVFTLKKAQQKLKHLMLIPSKRVDITKNFYRFRIREPELFSRFSTIEIEPGVKFVIGYY